MKTLIKAILTIGLFSIFATSCSSKKQNCDAYGVISQVENTTTDVVISVKDELTIDKKS